MKEYTYNDLRNTVLRFTDGTYDMFGDTRTHAQRAEAIELQERGRMTRGGPANTFGLPIFGQDQTDLFFQETKK